MNRPYAVDSCDVNIYMDKWMEIRWTVIYFENNFKVVLSLQLNDQEVNKEKKNLQSPHIAYRF